MKKIFLILLPFFTIYLNAQTPSWSWAKSMNGTDINYITKTVTDSQNNIYILGRFYLGINFQTISLTTNYSANYLTKFDPSGNVIWAKKIENGGVNNIIFSFLKIDINDNILMGGYASLNTFSGNINYNDETSIYFEPTPNLGNSRYFSMKIDATTGSADWYDTDFGKSSLYSGDIDNSNNYYFFGDYNVSISIEGTLLQSTTASGADFYILKKNNNNLIWAEPFNFNCILLDPKIKVINNQNLVLVAKTFSEDFSFQNNSFHMGNTNIPKLILLKLDLNGNFISFNYYVDCPFDSNASSQDNCYIDEDGSIFLYGTFIDNTLQIGSTTLNKIGTEDIYVSKFNSNANLLWAKSIGVQNFELNADCFITHNGNILIGSDFNPIGNFTINNSNYVCNGAFTSLFIKLDADFNYIWTKSATGIGNQNGNYPNTLTYNNQNEIIMTGVYNCENISFDNFNLLDTNSTNSYNKSFFAKLIDNNLTTTDFNKNLATMYPNPVNDNLSISGIENLKGTSYSITDTSGRIINNGIITDSSNYSFEVSNLKTGIYFFTTNNGFCQKFIKE
ncbi:T9SS type A sorting domain-containing protein [Flavobacterium aciduliphilum]|uniref:Putative secreted protein (Por secretion system target) n=1 Tax=Flavobacterium aciduliphilum TaxID=1101402 RepID=A0A328YN78_9FLAO|nr:T9SS type A sorting domain-containing protein [Flavobacterium aciduliphilum]RAR75548.1 putative secreted protein (Por secretion system target) [Flavobacterium aciduliphilum]